MCQLNIFPFEFRTVEHCLVVSFIDLELYGLLLILEMSWAIEQPLIQAKQHQIR